MPIYGPFRGQQEAIVIHGPHDEGCAFRHAHVDPTRVIQPGEILEDGDKVIIKNWHLVALRRD